MNQRKHTIRLLHFLLCCGLCLLILPVQATPAQAKGFIPAECLDDQGNSFTPGQPGAWLLMLNFNHQPSTEFTTGCLVFLDRKTLQPVYQLVKCPLVNNRKQVAVGNGAAEFDGHFWAECQTPATARQLTQFSLQARALFAQPGAYSLVEHQSVAFGATIDVDWRVSLRSRYGGSTFQHHDPATIAYQQELLLLSQVVDKQGSHAVNGVRLQPPAQVAAFDYQSASPLRISAPGQYWSLSELIVDPAGICCNG